jgi:hypothetical protein
MDANYALLAILVLVAAVLFISTCFISPFKSLLTSCAKYVITPVTDPNFDKPLTQCK